MKQVVKWTAEGAVKCEVIIIGNNHIITKYSATLKADVICRGYVSILLRAWYNLYAMNQGGTADSVALQSNVIYSSLTE